LIDKIKERTLKARDRDSTYVVKDLAEKRVLTKPLSFINKVIKTLKAAKKAKKAKASCI
jgi:hypothetical protein